MRDAFKVAIAWIDRLISMARGEAPDEWARGFRDAVIFVLAAFLIAYGLLSIGGA